LLGQLAKLGYGPDRVVPVAFHVDYFNDPWKDPLSDPKFSGREWQYSLIYQRDRKGEKPNELYFTPMLMVDGKYPMLGSNKAEARTALDKALKDRPGVTLELSLKDDPGDPRRKTLTATLSDPSLPLLGREVLVGVATYEDPVTTKVPSGENAGQTLVEHYAVRKLVVEATTPERGQPVSLTFPVALEKGWDAAKCGLAVFVQDEHSGRIHQAGSIRWEAGKAK
jgi:hypothetical protein